MANQFGADVFGENLPEGRNDEPVSGVQMDAPMSSGFEVGFDVPGMDMSGLASRAPYPVGVDLPGVPMGVTTADVMAGMAEPEQFHDGNDIVGVLSDDASFVGDVAASAGLHLVTTFDEMFGSVPGREFASMADPEDGQASRGLLHGSVSNQGYPNGGPGVGGIDSMQGLDFAGIPAPIGEQDTNSTAGGQS